MGTVDGREVRLDVTLQLKVWFAGPVTEEAVHAWVTGLVQGQDPTLGQEVLGWYWDTKEKLDVEPD